MDYFTLILILIAILVLRYVYRLLTDPLKDIPGPPLARFTWLWEWSELKTGHLYKTVSKLHARHGPIVRLGPNRYSVHDPSSMRMIYGIGSKFEKSQFYLPFGSPNPMNKDVFSEMSNAKHAVTRRLISSMYSMSTLTKSYEPFVDEVNVRFMKRLDAFAQEGQSWDLFTWMQFYAFDVVGDISCGRSFGLVEAGWDKDKLLAAVHFVNQVYGAQVGLFPWMHYLGLIAIGLSFALPIEWHLKIIYKVMSREVTARRVGKTRPDREDFTAKCMKLMDEGKMTMGDLQNVVGQNIGAGSDTTGIGLSSIIYFLIKNPTCMRKLQAELDEATKDGTISQTVTFQEGQKLPYLQAVIKESLRCHSVGGMVPPRVVPTGGAEIAGRHFPGGTVVGMSQWMIHLDKDIWGEDADQFRPERWLVSKEELAVLDQHFVAFGMGARTCIGKNISLLEMTKLLPTMLRQFEFEAAREGEWETDGAWFVKTTYSVRVRRRQSIG